MKTKRSCLDEHHTSTHFGNLCIPFKMNTCCHQWTAKTLDKHTQPILWTHMGTYLI